MSEDAKITSAKGESVQPALAQVQIHVKVLYWAIGAISLGLTALVGTTLLAISKSDKAQTSSEVMRADFVAVSKDVEWIKHTLDRIETKIDKGSQQ